MSLCPNSLFSSALLVTLLISCGNSDEEPPAAVPPTVAKVIRASLHKYAKYSSQNFPAGCLKGNEGLSSLDERSLRLNLTPLL